MQIRRERVRLHTARHDHLALAMRRVVLALELQSLGMAEEATLYPLGPSQPPPG